MNGIFNLNSINDIISYNEEDSNFIKENSFRVKDIEDVIVTRNDNDANVISFSGKSSLELSLAIINRMIDTPVSMEERHVRRVNMIDKYND